ncbi:MAG TPA: nicotinate-nucleotide adenylyltransferase [Phycisphaerae bacterium]|nr:nicotinate-nucleotide adenylyltransferase [Phycisphaerae bacterium]HRY69984.1 nicotinate-nucleotide adenylyltransferase [Phycisphaerae bacterium]HSA27193.1 nicotinate-nucleotide adenylyltransferase [Phycisphaerae bacterium]
MAGGVALFGGSFNPIHHGHLIIARAVAERLDLVRLVLIPSANPPHKVGQDLADAADRLAMVRLAIADEPFFEVSDTEIRRRGTSYTILTLEEYRSRLAPGEDLYWIIGGDTISELHTWYRARELVDLCRIVTAVRPGFETPDLSVLQPTLSAAQVERLRRGILETPRVDISATDVRRRVAEGLSIRFLVPEAVREYIERKELYR